MKKVALLIFTSLSLCTCKMYVQVFDTNSQDNKIENDFYTFENDTLKILYSFWSEKGLMIFSIYNKLEKPLYVDWKKSSYIDNSNKLNYWVDEEISKSIAVYGSYYYDGPLLMPGYALSSSASAGISTTRRLERITFIPPKSNYYRSQFYILPIPYFNLDVNSELSIEARSDNPKKKTKVYTKKYSKENSPLIFRNFLTFSFSEDFKNEFYIDNEFYISTIREMDIKHFEFYKMQEKGHFIEKDKDGNYVYIRPYKKETSFYLRIPKYGSIKSRK
jgi:hypothetical protein